MVCRLLVSRPSSDDPFMPGWLMSVICCRRAGARKFEAPLVPCSELSVVLSRLLIFSLRTVETLQGLFTLSP